MPLPKHEIAARAERLKQIYREYLAKLFPLRKERNEIVNAYVERTEAKQEEDVRRRIMSA